MGFAEFLEAFIAFFKAIPLIARLFTKVEAEKQSKINETVSNESAAMKDTGRPTWKD